MLELGRILFLILKFQATSLTSFLSILLRFPALWAHWSWCSSVTTSTLMPWGLCVCCPFLEYKSHDCPLFRLTFCLVVTSSKKTSLIILLKSTAQKKKGVQLFHCLFTLHHSSSQSLLLLNLMFYIYLFAFFSPIRM